MNKMDQVARRHVRTEVGVDIKATIEVGERSGRCTVENISPGGAQITTRIPLTRGQSVTLVIGSIGTVTGVVAWVNRNTFGLKFASDMDAIADLLLAVAIY